MNSEPQTFEAFRMKFYANPKPIPPVEQEPLPIKRLQIKSSLSMANVFDCLCDYYSLSREDLFNHLVSRLKEETLEHIYRTNPNAPLLLDYQE